MSTSPPSRRRARPLAVSLTAPGWNVPTRRALEALIRRGAGKGLPAVFDFDNTIVQGDIGEAVLAQLARTGRLVPGQVPEELCPPLARPRGKRLRMRDCADVTEYYERFLRPTAHGSDDPEPLGNAYAWAVQVMSGLRLAEVVAATREVLALADSATPQGIQARPGGTTFPVPVFHPEMVELIAVLVRHEFDVWIVSASNAWSVRWTVRHALNPLLAEHGVARGLAADHVLGVATLLADARGQLFKDAVLVRQNARHADLVDRATHRLRLTSQLQFPVPAYSGKVACILDAIGRRPYFCAGDGLGDHAMLMLSEHRLWIARLRERVGSQGGVLRETQNCPAGWLVQATREAGQAGFVSQADAIPRAALPPEWRVGHRPARPGGPLFA